MKGNNKPYVKCYFIYFKQLSENSEKGTTVIYVNTLFLNWLKSYCCFYKYTNHACSYHAGRNCYPIVAHVLLIVAAVYNKIACLIERVSIVDTNRIC